MLTSALILVSLLPLQISSAGRGPMPLNKPLTVAVFLDVAKIIGLPKFKLRDSRGNLYVPDKALLEEPLAIIYANANIPAPDTTMSQRKQYISAYVRR